MMSLTAKKLGVMALSNKTQALCHAREISVLTCLCQRRQDRTESKEDEGEFRKFEIPGMRGSGERRRFHRRKKEVQPPRYRQMATDQDWTNVWPAASSFKWSVVPLPVRQGVAEKTTENDGITPGKYANAELMKIPNFFHLTPKHVQKHCKALKKFCSDWPKGLETDEKIQSHFPLTVKMSDYCFNSTKVRDNRSRLVTVEIPLSSLELDYHARDKILRLVGKRYNHKTDTITIKTDRCPVKKQNYEYSMYLLTALYYESWKTEPWEDEKTEADMEEYFWNLSQSRKSVISLLQRVKEIDQTKSPKDKKLSYLPDDISEDKIIDLAPVQEYKEAVANVINEGEDHDNLLRYKNSVKKLLNIQAS